MSGKGNCYDNAAVETFFKSLKAALLWRQTWPTRRQAEAAIFQYINGFYNARRRHSYLGGISPLAFEAKVALRDQSPAQNRYKSNLEDEYGGSRIFNHIDWRAKLNLPVEAKGVPMLRTIFVFASAKTATANVAGVPAIARVAREATLAASASPECRELLFALPGGRPNDEWCDEEIARLSPGSAECFIATDRLVPVAGDLFFAGELLLSAENIVAAFRLETASPLKPRSKEMLTEVLRFQAEQGSAGLIDLLHQSERGIVRNTAKASDGIVSRYLNRTISTRISTILLRTRSFRPIHATAAAALTALLMFGCLASGTYAGLITGAILFQVASVIDGIDGEIARATFRESTLGATLDSLTDAATNLAFLLGLGLSLTQQGSGNALALGVAGFACLGTGLALLGSYATMSGRPVNFDALKHVVRRQHSFAADLLIWLTMRDFLALASAVMVVLGFGCYFLKIFALGSLIWFMAVLVFILHDTLEGRRNRSQKTGSE